MVCRHRRRLPVTLNDDTDTTTPPPTSTTTAISPTTSPPTANDNEGTSPLIDEENDSIVHTNDEEKSLMSNVWHYAKKVTNDTAQCTKCKMQIKTIRGGTTTLRKHLINKHKLVHLSLPLSSLQKNDI